MTIRNFDKLFAPQSVAFFGASPKPGSVGRVVARNLLAAGFGGPVWLVNPRHREIEGIRCYKDLEALPGAPDLAVIATPPATVPELVARLGARGTRAAVIITAGFGEGGDGTGRDLRQRLLDAAQPHCLRIVGPNGVGMVAPAVRLNASFVHVPPLAGDLAFVSQSGAVVTSVVDWATARGIGFSKIVSLGDMADVDFGDMLDHLAMDRATRAILLYIEAVTHTRKFMSAARKAARSKPVVVVKAGRHAEGAKAAASHTGALAGADAVYDAAFRRAGLLRVFDLDELFDAVETLAHLRQAAGDRLAILTNGGGMGVLATDRLADEGGRLAALAPDTLAALDAVLPPTWSKANPVDIIGDAGPERYGAALRALLDDRETDAVLVLNCPVAVASSSDAAKAVVETCGQGSPGGVGRIPVLTAWLGSDAAAEARALFAKHRIPTYETPAQAVRAFMHMVRYRRAQAMLQEMPPSLPEDFSTDPEAARGVIGAALAEGRSILSEIESKQVLAAYGLPVVPTVVAPDPAAVRRAAEDLLAEDADGRWGAAPPGCAVKVLSPDITHKSDVGGVRLDLTSPRQAEIAAAEMSDHLRRDYPEARLEGFTVQPMVRRPGAEELILGVSEDRQFGPVILFGEGGTAVEVLDDKALALPPLNLHLAHDLITQTRVYGRLQGYRDRPAAKLDALALALVQVSQMTADLAEIIELDINPLLADPAGVIALDARIRVAASDAPPAARLAIRPYPTELERDLFLGDGMPVFVRPVRPEDERLYHAAATHMNPEDIRLRLFRPVKELTHRFLVQFTQIDYDREMALVALSSRRSDDAELLGVARLACEPDKRRAEFAIIVRSDLKGRGLGWMLMQQLIDYARGHKIGTLFGEVLHENRPMLTMCEALGFRIATSAEDPRVVEVTMELTGDPGCND